MQNIITKGLGQNQAIVTQGYGLIELLIAASRRVMSYGKAGLKAVKSDIENILIRATLLSVNDSFVDLSGQSRGTLDRQTKFRTSVSLLRKRLIKSIRLSVNRLK